MNSDPLVQLVSIAEASRMTGIHRNTLGGLVRRGALDTFELPLDRRLRLVRLAEVEALRVPVPSTRKATTTAPAEISAA